MPYWRYPLVRARLQPTHMCVRDEIMEEYLPRDVLEECFSNVGLFKKVFYKWVRRLAFAPANGVSLEAQFLFGSDESFLEYVTRLGLKAPKKDGEHYYAAYRHMSSVVGTAMKKLGLRGGDPPYFLEPTIVDALARTPPGSVCAEDVAEVTSGKRICFPDQLIKLIRDGEEDFWLEEIHLLRFVPTVIEGVPHKALTYVQQFAHKSNHSCGERGKTLHQPGVHRGRTVQQFFIREDAQLNCMGQEDFYLKELDEQQVNALCPQFCLNFLLYLTSDDPDILRSLNPEYDKASRRVMEAKDESSRSKRRKKLKRLDQHPHLVVGQHLEIIRRRAENTDGERDSTYYTSEGMRSRARRHFRRGHWRWQACGPALSKRKLIWVEGMVVNEDMPEAEVVGFSVRT